MDFDKVSVQFSIDNLYHGFAQADGILTITEKELILEIQTRDALIGMIKSSIKRIRIPLNEVAEIEYKKKCFSDRILITARSLNLFQDLPLEKPLELVLKLNKKSRNITKRLVSQTEYLMLQNKINEMDNS